MERLDLPMEIKAYGQAHASMLIRVIAELSSKMMAALEQISSHATSFDFSPDLNATARSNRTAAVNINDSADPNG